MTINKFQGKTKEEAIEKAKKEFGSNTVIMNVKEVKPKGLFRAFKNSTFEVTAAMEEQETYMNPMSALQTPKKMHDNINLAADEKIEIPKPERTPIIPSAIKQFEIPKVEKGNKPEKSEKEAILDSRLEQLSNVLEEKLGEVNTNPATSQNQKAEELKFVRMLYNTLISNEVNEKYVNQILEEMEKFLRPGNSVDNILANVYQKLILKFGQPKTIELGGKKPKIIFFMGPTGVGKTTTIAKIASKYKVENNKRVAFITADTYRIAATEQLRVYANILDAPMSIVYSAEEMNSSIERMLEYDMVFVDTAGFSHKNDSQREEMKQMLQGISSEYDKEVFLVLSATTKYKDLLDIVDAYHEISDYKLIFTKLDETTTYGNLLNIKLYSNAELSYVTNGQNVPDDIEVFDTQKIVKQLLGGRS